MPSIYTPILEEFESELDAVGAFALQSSATDIPAKIRVAAANAATLLLAATFEEFIREIARELAKAVVKKSASVEDLPKRLVEQVWKRHADAVGKIPFPRGQSVINRRNLYQNARIEFDAAHAFCMGDLSQNIYPRLIHNENNMHAGQINELFKICGAKDICREVANKTALTEIFGQDAGVSHGKVISSLEDFFSRRNEIAHAISLRRSPGSVTLEKDIDFLRRLGRALKDTVEEI